MTMQAKTRTGKTVTLNLMKKVEGGWTSYIMHARGYAVAIFIPGE